MQTLKFFTLAIFLLNLPTLAFLVPVNDLKIPITPETGITFSQSKFEENINAFRNYLSKEQIVLNVRWEDNSVNAFATNEDGLRSITLLGGLLRHPLMNSSILEAILCHEMGHHLGGHPYKKDDDGGDKWSSVEGKSDFFATNTCLKDYYQDQDNHKFLTGIKLNRDILNLCQQVNTSEKNLCLRLVYASQLTAEFSFKISGTRRGNRNPPPKLNKKDATVVTKTLEQHPAPQCRLDTFLGGVINEQDDSHYYPKCWFATE